MAEEGFEHYHIPQQSRREKLRILSQNRTTFLDSSSPTLHSPLPSLYDPSLNISSSDLLAKEERSNLMMRFMNSSCSSSTSTAHHGYLDPEVIQVITNSNSNSNCNSNSNPFLYQPQSLQTIREFNHGYNDGNHEVMVLKPEPLSLSLSSHNKGNQNQNQNHHPLELNSQRYGSVVVNGGFGSGGCDNVTRNTVPLGPFTGYASVLKGSRFLKPAQQLLDEICDVGVRGICSQKFTADFSLMETTQESFSGLDDSLGDANNDGRKNKSRLLTMLDEIYRRYRQYFQQIQAVVTSFEYVAGLGNAAPFASLAINAMSKHFRCLKNAITDQLQFISKSHFQIDNNIRKDESPRLCNNNGSPYGQRSGFLEHQQPVWRPQRGLPERAVSVLRGWLFEHFLHPYPTDTDKLMLAKQTGLSRNQVSNWFINARVRLWKPMVEEMHMLESQQGQKKPQREERHGRNNNLSDHLSSDNNIENPSTSTENFHDVPYKRSRNELANIPTRGQEQQLIHTNTSNQNQQVGIGMSMAGTNGASNGVSLTLGLHHHQNHGIGLSEPFSLNAAQRFGPALQPDQGYVFQSQNRQFGGQLLHDFVG